MDIVTSDLVSALAKDQLIPHFQPIVAMRTGRLSGFEVLARWDHPLHGAFLPGNMIELAGDCDLIEDVARQVFAKAFALIGAMPEPPQLSINLSSVQLVFAGLTRQIDELATKARYPLDHLTVEISESALLSDFKNSLRLAGELKELGCRLSLDDFGTGHSDLSRLQSLPFNELKIDRRFVTTMTESRDSCKIISAIIELGKSLGLSIVAKGVETEIVSDMLLWLGAELGQGWHYGRPSPFHVVRALTPAASAAATGAKPAAIPRPAVTGIAQLSLLKSTPPAVNIANGRIRQVKQENHDFPTPLQVVRPAPHAPGASGAAEKAVTPKAVTPIVAGAAKPTLRKPPLPVQSGWPTSDRLAMRLVAGEVKRGRDATRDLRNVDDLGTVQSELQRLVTLLEDFAEHRISSR